MKRSEHRALLQVGDGLLTLIAIASARWLGAQALDDAAFFLARGSQHWTWPAVGVAWWLLLAPSRRIGIVASLSASARWVAWAAAACLACFSAVDAAVAGALPRAAVAWFIGLASLLILAWRLTYRRVLFRERLRRRAVVVGAGDEGKAALAVMRRAAPDTRVVAFLQEQRAPGTESVEGLPVFSGPEGLETLIAEHRIGEIVLAGKTRIEDRLMQLLIACQESGIEVVRSRTVSEHLVGRVPVSEVDADWLFSSFADTIRLRDESDIARRALDVVGALAGCIVLLILAPAIALLIWLDDGPPILFRQVRTGRAGRPFALFKFRTMVRDAEAEGPRWATRGDSRATRVGRSLRRSRLDELPQFLNVLLGQMSLVGPRPERPEFVSLLEEAIPFYRVRLMVRPGLTGWAQVNCPYGESVEDAKLKLEFDLFYIKHRSMWFDLRVVAKTILTLLRLGGH